MSYADTIERLTRENRELRDINLELRQKIEVMERKRELEGDTGRAGAIGRAGAGEVGAVGGGDTGRVDAGEVGTGKATGADALIKTTKN